MTPEEIRAAGTPELARRRMELLRRRCPSCDDGRETASCSCEEEFREVDLIEHEVTGRGDSFR